MDIILIGGGNRLGSLLDNYDLDKKKVRPEHRARRYIRTERNNMKAVNYPFLTEGACSSRRRSSNSLSVDCDGLVDNRLEGDINSPIKIGV